MKIDARGREGRTESDADGEDVHPVFLDEGLLGFGLLHFAFGRQLRGRAQLRASLCGAMNENVRQVVKPQDAVGKVEEPTQVPLVRRGRCEKHGPRDVVGMKIQ